MPEHSEDKSLVEQHFEQSCFIVFSSRESHIKGVIDSLTDLLVNELRVRPIRLDEAREPGEVLQTQLLEIMRACNFGVVFLDGFRPNILFELGLLVAFGIPRLIMLERSSTINLASLMKDSGKTSKVPKLRIDVHKQLSDLSNIGITYYSASNDLDFRALVRKDIKKLIARVGKGTGVSLEFALVGKTSASRRLSKGRLRALIVEIAAARTRLSLAQYAHVTMHLSQALCRRNERALALRVISDELKKNSSPALIAQHAYILHGMGQSADAFDDITAAFRRHRKDMAIVRAYCVLAVETERPQSALKVLTPFSYEQLVLAGLIRTKAQALFMIGERAKAIELLLDLYEGNRTVAALGQATYLMGLSVDSLLPGDLEQRLGRLIALGVKKKELKCKTCISGAAIVLRIRELIPIALKPERVAGEGEPGQSNSRAFQLIHLERFREARAILDEALKRFPADSYLCATDGLYALRAERNLAVGTRRYDEAVRLAPDDGALKRMRLYQIGSFYLRTGHASRAREFFRKALRVGDLDSRQFLLSELTSLLA